MRRSALWIALALMVAALSVAASEKVRTVQESYPAASVKALSLDLPVGDLKLEAWDGKDVQVVMDITCNSSDCREKAEGLKLESSTSDQTLTVAVKGFPKHDSGGIGVHLFVKMPPSLAFSADIGVGDAEASGLQGDVSIKIGVGDAELTGAASSVHSASLEAGVGDAHMSVPGKNPESTGFIGKVVSWSDGKGSATWRVKVGVGDIKAEAK